MKKPGGTVTRKEVDANLRQKNGSSQSQSVKLKPEYLHDFIRYIDRKLVPRFPWPAKAISVSDSGETKYGRWRLPNFKDLNRVLDGRRRVLIVDQNGETADVEKPGKVDQTVTIEVHHIVPKYIQKIAGISVPGSTLWDVDLSPAIAWSAIHHQRDFHREALNRYISKDADTLEEAYPAQIGIPDFQDRARRQLLIDLAKAYDDIREPRLGAIAVEWLLRRMEKKNLSVHANGLPEPSP